MLQLKTWLSEYSIAFEAWEKTTDEAMQKKYKRMSFTVG